MEYLFIYLLDLFDSLDFIKIAIFVFAIVIIIFMFSFCMYDLRIFDKNDDRFDNERKILDKLKQILIKLLIVNLIIVFIPCKQTLLLMGGTYLGKRAVNEVVNSDKLEKINTIIDLQLDKYIKELKGNNND